MNYAYIRAAQRRFGNRGSFLCKYISMNALPNMAQFDIALALGVVHHLNDHEATELFQLAGVVLKPGGRLVTLDGVYCHDQSRVERFVLSKDRGRHVRTRNGYLDLASKVFGTVNVTIRRDLLRIPYTHIILECTK